VQGVADAQVAFTDAVPSRVAPATSGATRHPSGNEKGVAPRRRDPSNWMAPRPGLEPGTCGLTGQRRAGRGATSAKKRNGFSGGEGRGRDAPNLFRTVSVGIHPAPPGAANRNNGLRRRRPNGVRTCPSPPAACPHPRSLLSRMGSRNAGLQLHQRGQLGLAMHPSERSRQWR